MKTGRPEFIAALAQSDHPIADVTTAHRALSKAPVTTRDAFTPEKPRGPRLIREFPHPQAVEKLAQIAAVASGTAQEVLKAAASAAARTARPSVLEIVLEKGVQARDDVLSEIREPVQGTFKREWVVRADGTVQVRARFRQHRILDDSKIAVRTSNWIDLPLQGFAGLANGATVTLEPPSSKKGRDGGWTLRFDPATAHPVVNMIGTVVQENGKLFVAAATKLSPLQRLELRSAAKPEDLVGKTVVVDVKNGLTPGAYAVLHDVLDETNTLRMRQMRIAADCGIAIAFPADVLAEAQALAAVRPSFEATPEIADFGDKIFVSTDNPGSRSDYRSADPEQATCVETRPGGGWIVYDALTYRRPLLPRDGAIERHAAVQQFTVYADGADAPTMPTIISEDLAVFIEDQPRYAQIVKTVYDASGKAIDDEAEVFTARVTNRWQGSYREAERYFIDPKGQTQGLSPAVLAQLDASRALLDARNALNGTSDRHDGRYSAELFRELFSISGNKAVGRIIRECGGVSVHRYHPDASTVRLSSFQGFAEAMGVPWGNSTNLVDYARKLDPEDPRSEVLAQHAMRSMGFAYYSIRESGHAGLETDDYDQSTAANRRGPDIINLEQGAAASQSRKTGKPPQWRWNEKQAEPIQDQANGRQALAKLDVQGYFNELRAAEALASAVGTTVEAKLMDIKATGLTFVAQGGTIIEVPLRRLSDAFEERFDIVDSNSRIVSESGQHDFKCAKTYTLSIDAIDVELGMVRAVPSSARPATSG